MAFGNPAAERAAIEATYDGMCSVWEYKDVKDPVTHVTRQQAVAVLEDQPCALSQTKLTTTSQTEAANEILYDAKLFISPDVTIAAGSWIRVQQDSMDYEFEQVGEPFRYPTHQEVMLKRKVKA